jgi:hypothetical protein
MILPGGDSGKIQRLRHGSNPLLVITATILQRGTLSMRHDDLAIVN